MEEEIILEMGWHSGKYLTYPRGLALPTGLDILLNISIIDNRLSPLKK